MNDKVKEEVNHLIEWFGESYSDMSYRKASLIVGLLGYFAEEDASDEIHAETSKLTSIIESLRILESLLSTLESRGRNEFHWSPHFHREELPQSLQSLTLSPTFNVQQPDDTPLISEIEKIREEIKQTPIKLELLINYIIKRASVQGYLNNENG